MRQALTVLAISCAVILAIAFATDTSFASNPTTYDSVTGSSAWHYGDRYDTPSQPGGDALKYEGSYRLFTAGELHAADNSAGPHYGYVTTSNFCMICHAIHRSDGIYDLLRSDDPDSACDYCHIGTAIHSTRPAYYRSTEGKYTRNGHTIGAGPEIPDSSVWQWEETRTLSSADGTVVGEVAVREYKTAENKIFKIGGHGGRMRIGPYLLRCQVCHSVHNASLLIWKPGNQIKGYRLLRNSPSGSVDSLDVMENYKSGQRIDPVGGMPANVKLLETPETTITSTNTGLQPDGTMYTLWTRWQGPDTGVHDGTYLSVWCADCHNLDIGYPNKTIGTLLGGSSHTARTHPVPYMQDGGLADDAPQCYSCHVTDMYPSNSTTCYGQCHITPSGYSKMASKSDFPHSGDEASTKLLGDMPNTDGTNAYVMPDGSETNTPYVYGYDEIGDPITTAYDRTTEHVDLVCLRCHVEDIGITQ